MDNNMDCEIANFRDDSKLIRRVCLIIYFCLTFVFVLVLQPASFDVIMAARAFVKMVEYKLLQLRNDHNNKILRSECRKVCVPFILYSSCYLNFKK